MATTSNVINSTGAELPSIPELEEYGAMIVNELDRAEASLEDGENQPFSGMSQAVMNDIGHLRNWQFDLFRRHVDIERTHKIRGADTFSAIATTMRKKEVATAALLNRLADFDGQLRATMDKFEPTSTGSDEKLTSTKNGKVPAQGQQASTMKNT